MIRAITAFYKKRVYPVLMESSLKSKKVTLLRKATLLSAHGNILEIGFGTGLNVLCYPKEVKKITAIDIIPSMKDFLLKKAEGRDLEIEIHNMSAEDLEFEDKSFDCIVSTFTLCSIPHPDRALAEFKRVLKPEGRFLFLEHGANPNKAIRVLQNLTNPLFNVFACGCNVNREIKNIIVDSGFQLDELETVNMMPPISGYTYRGTATIIMERGE